MVADMRDAMYLSFLIFVRFYIDLLLDSLDYFSTSTTLEEPE